MKPSSMTAEPGTMPYETEDSRWTAVVARDASADGHFVYSVRSTGIYCRPSCGARLPRRENVAFHPSPEAAERAGFRPCRRCRPDGLSRAERNAGIVERACRLIESAETAPSLEALAADAGMSAHHFHRLFAAVAGVTPGAYAAGHRARQVRRALGRHDTVAAAVYEAGYNSGTRFYADAPAVLGMTPRQFRAGGDGALIRFAVGECSLGSILVAATEKGVCAIELADDPETLVRELEDRFPKAELVGGDAGFERLVAQVVGLVEAPCSAVLLPLDIRGTAFQQRVWRALREIPPGSTATYTEIAARLGVPKAVRAVAAACAANSLAVAIPCHRVVRRDGGLAGYRWGVERKRRLLEREGVRR